MLGVGGMGRVYRVRNLISDRTEAMKVLLPDLVAEPDLAERFTSEIRILAGFDHPNIAQLHTAFQADNQLVMMMEFVEGFTLHDLAKRGPIPQSDIINYMQQVLSALSYAHGRGVIHRDIKPANIMVTSQGVVKLMDFGIAKSGVEKDLTRTGTTLGSLYYMSPEQVRGGTVDARSDIYSVGVTMYELLAGRRPFVSDSAYDILHQQCNIAPQPPIEINPQLSPGLNDIILCALAKEPVNRFQNANAVSNALRHVTAAQNTTPKAETSTPKAENVAFAPVVVPDAVPVAALARPTSSHRGAWISLGAFAVLAILALAAVGLPRLLHTSAKTAGTSDPTAPAPPSSDSPAAHSPDASAPAVNSSPADAPMSNQAQAVEPPQAPAKADSAPPPHSQTLEKPKLPRPEYHPDGQVTTAAPPDVAKQPETAGPTPEQVNQAHEQMAGLDARASAVSASLETLKKQQEAEGLGLRRDMAAAYARMNTYLHSAGDELNSGNITAAGNHMDKADKEISTLESFLGK
jgi:eukaryotic-like serine/threonine-protein kinase